MEPTYLTRAQAAQRLDVSERTLDRWADNAENPDRSETRPRRIKIEDRPGVWFDEQEIESMVVPVSGT